MYPMVVVVVVVEVVVSDVVNCLRESNITKHQLNKTSAQ